MLEVSFRAQHSGVEESQTPPNERSLHCGLTPFGRDDKCTAGVLRHPHGLALQDHATRNVTKSLQWLRLVSDRQGSPPARKKKEHRCHVPFQGSPEPDRNTTHTMPQTGHRSLRAFPVIKLAILTVTLTDSVVYYFMSQGVSPVLYDETSSSELRFPSKKGAYNSAHDLHDNRFGKDCKMENSSDCHRQHVTKATETVLRSYPAKDAIHPTGQDVLDKSLERVRIQSATFI